MRRPRSRSVKSCRAALTTAEATTALARIESGAEHLALTDLDLAKAVGDCLERHVERARAKGQRLELAAPDGELVVARGDEEAIREILDNLVDNAVRHAKSRVDIHVGSRDSNVILTVSDDGPGIAPVDRARVFERFVRLDSDRARSGGGTGLGLAIVAEVVAAHGGTVNVEDHCGDGTTIIVTLPQQSNR